MLRRQQQQPLNQRKQLQHWQRRSIFSTTLLLVMVRNNSVEPVCIAQSSRVKLASQEVLVNAGDRSHEFQMSHSCVASISNVAKTAKFDPLTGKLLSCPVILKVDSGPGRMVASAESIQKRAEYYEKGLLILMGLPNTTSVQQEMDIIYQGLKAATYAYGHALLAYKRMVSVCETQANRIKKQHVLIDDEEVEELQQPPAATTLSIGFDELSIVVHGIDGDPPINV